MHEFAKHLDHCMNEAERFLSKAAAIPILGSPFGAVKVLTGTLQFITALAIGIIIPILLCVEDDYFYSKYLLTHIEHGLANIIAGIFESIPFVGLGLNEMRKARLKEANRNLETVITGHADKWLPYDQLVDRDRKDPEAKPLPPPRGTPKGT